MPKLRSSQYRQLLRELRSEEELRIELRVYSLVLEFREII